ncbi:MAG: AMP-binding protein, partial [Rhizobiaceae bacterium]
MTGWTPSQNVLAAGRATVGGLFLATVAAHRNEIALTQGDAQFTFGKLQERSCRLANVLKSLNVAKGDRVAILAHNCTEYIELELAAAMLGAVVAAINCRLGPRELAHCIDLAAPSLLIVQPELR